MNFHDSDSADRHEYPDDSAHSDRTDRTDRFFRFVLTMILVVAIGLAVLAIYTLASFRVSAATNTPRQFHVSGVALPASAASPTPIEGTALTTDVNVDGMWICNKDTSTHTVTIEDCGSPQFVAFNAYTIAASTMWPIPGFNTRFRGCFKWTADSTLVMGTVVGTR